MPKRSARAVDDQGEIIPGEPPRPGRAHEAGEVPAGATDLPRGGRIAGQPARRGASEEPRDESAADDADTSRVAGDELSLDDSAGRATSGTVTTWIVSEPSPPVPGPRRSFPFKSPDGRPGADAAAATDAPQAGTPTGQAQTEKDRSVDPRPQRSDALPTTGREDPAFRELASGLFSDLPADPGRRLEAVTDRIDTFRRQAVRQLEAAANAFLRSQRPETLRDKQAVAEAVNSKLAKIGASIHYKGQACNLIATTGGGSPSGRFVVVPIGSQTPLLTRVNLADILPLELIDTPRRFASRER